MYTIRFAVGLNLKSMFVFMRYFPRKLLTLPAPLFFNVPLPLSAMHIPPFSFIIFESAYIYSVLCICLPFATTRYRLRLYFFAEHARSANDFFRFVGGSYTVGQAVGVNSVYEVFVAVPCKLAFCVSASRLFKAVESLVK